MSGCCTIRHNEWHTFWMLMKKTMHYTGTVCLVYQTLAGNKNGANVKMQFFTLPLKQYHNDRVKKCMEYEVEGPIPKGRPKRTWSEVVENDCQARKLNKKDAVDHNRWRKLIKDVWWSGWVWVGECFFWYWPTHPVPAEGPLNGCVWHYDGTLCAVYLCLP